MLKGVLTNVGFFGVGGLLSKWNTGFVAFTSFLSLKPLVLKLGVLQLPSSCKGGQILSRGRGSGEDSDAIPRIAFLKEKEGECFH